MCVGGGVYDVDLAELRFPSEASYWIIAHVRLCGFVIFG